MIYGVATLAACMFIGQLLGNILGLLTGTGSDIGGVGFSMLLLLLVTNSDKLKFTKDKDFSAGIMFWNKMYIPVVIAMAASQNVFQALSEGWIALLAGMLAVVFAFMLLPVLNRKTSTSIEVKDGANNE